MDNFAINVPVPHDIPLDLPLPLWLLVGLLVFSFLLHILFVNLMLGGTFLTWWAERKGRENQDYDTLAKEIAKTITVNKSIAVVLGVAPLLSINALYTIYFYSANALTGKFWISLVPLITVIFLLIYWHKYSWEKYENKKSFHIGIITVASLMFLFVPLIFLTNMNLMMFPEQWGQINGFWDAMFQSNLNVFARYLHFLTASFAVTGLFLFGYMRRKKYDTEKIFSNFSKDELLKKWYKLTLYASLLQFLFGPLVFFTLPWKGVTWELAYIFIAGIIFAIAGITLLYLDLKNKISLGKHFSKVVIAITITVMFMGTGRQTYRAIVLAPHQEMVAEKTELFKIQAQQALERYEANSNIEQISIQVDKKLDRFTRRDLYKILIPICFHQYNIFQKTNVFSHYETPILRRRSAQVS
jgi:cytochrome c